MSRLKKSRTYYRKSEEFDSLREYKPPEDPRLMGARCDVCPLRHSKPVWGDGAFDRSIAIIGEAPGREEVSAGMPFIGRSGQYVENLLASFKISRRDVWIDNAVMCFPDGGDMKAFLQLARKRATKEGQEFHSPVDCCRPRLFRMLGISRCLTCGLWVKVPPGPLRCTCKRGVQKVSAPTVPNQRKQQLRQPVSVVALGNTALEALTGHGGIKAKQLYRFDSQ